MPTEDRFDPADPLPRFLAEREEQDFGNYRDEGVVLSRLFKASLLVAAVAVTGLAVVAVGNPLALFRDATASLVGNSSPQPAADQPAPAIQSAENAPASDQPTAGVQAFAQALPPPATDVPARQENTAAGPVSKDQAEPSDAASEILFRQFQTWLSEQDTQAKAAPAQPAQDPPAQVARDPALAAPAPIMQEAPVEAAENVRPARRLAQKRRPDPAVHNAQADPHAQSVRKPPPRAQDARAARPAQDARAQEPPAPQPAQAPSFLPIFGQRN